MVDWLGIGHLFELSRTEATLGFFTPLAIFAVFFLAQLILPGRWVPGYVINPETGEPRKYRLNGIAGVSGRADRVGLRAHRDAAGLVLPLLDLCGGGWNRLHHDLHVPGGVPPAARAGSRIRSWRCGLGGPRSCSSSTAASTSRCISMSSGGRCCRSTPCPGRCTTTNSLAKTPTRASSCMRRFSPSTSWTTSSSRRVQLYTYDLIHENVGFKLFWGGLVVYGWMFILPLWGMAAYPDPGFSPAWTNVWLIGTAALFLFGWGILRGANLQKYTFKRWPDRKFLGLIEPKYIEAGDRKILCSGLWGVARHFNYLGEGFLSLSIALVFGYFTNPWAWTYFVFIVSLFAYRQRDDDRHCAEKYGAEKWADYQAQVKYRIVPGVY